jgi:hypothetical protein
MLHIVRVLQHDEVASCTSDTMPQLIKRQYELIHHSCKCTHELLVYKQISRIVEMVGHPPDFMLDNGKDTLKFFRRLIPPNTPAGNAAAAQQQLQQWQWGNSSNSNNTNSSSSSRGTAANSASGNSSSASAGALTANPALMSAMMEPSVPREAGGGAPPVVPNKQIR